MKKKIGFGVIVLLELITVVLIYIVKGQIAPWVWSANVFIIAPIACVTLIVQILAGIIRFCKRKDIKWNMFYIGITLIAAYPITILFGVSVLTYPSSGNERDTITMLNPVENSVLFGGKEYKTHAVWPSERYAYDILKEPYDNASDKLEDYGIYLADVYAPVSGVVIDVKDTEEDIPPNTEEFKSLLGNYIFMEIEDTGTYLILAHLEKDSVSVSVGDSVTEGTVIAKVGNSGTTSEPHLHIQHQRTNPMNVKFPTCAEGLPIKFNAK